MFALIFEKGMVTLSWYAWLALRRRVSMSAIGSVMVMLVVDLSCRGSLRPAAKQNYQEAFDTPGSSPRCAISRMQMRQRPNLRYTAFGRPHRWQRVYGRTADSGF